MKINIIMGTYQGRFQPKNAEKYHGDINNIVYRSSWERAFMRYCDMNPSILKWNSEEVVVPYRDPVDGHMHRYFLDMWICYRAKDGSLKQKIIEIKPYAQTQEPEKKSRVTKRYLREVRTYLKNTAKWEHAQEWASRNNMEFQILTENELGSIIPSIKKRKKRKRR